VATAPLNARGSFLVYCTGLGAVDAAIDPAMPAPASAVNAKIMPVVTVGGQAAAVSFAGLAPGFTGLYTIRATLPGGISPGDGIPVVVSSAGQSSAVVNVSIR
jgi:uncharacterized protein (TIGR03437 family)